MTLPERLRLYARHFEDIHAPQNVTIAMREAADQMDASRKTTLQLLGQVGQLTEENETNRKSLMKMASAMVEQVETIERLRAALHGVIRVADRDTAEFIEARAALEVE